MLNNVEYITVPLRDIVTFHNGFPFESSAYTTQGYKVVTIANVQSGYMATSSFRYIAQLPSGIQPYHFLHKRDILVSMTGNVGRVCKNVVHNALLNQRVGKLVSEYILSEYLYNILNTPDFIQAMKSKAKGIAQENIGREDILSYTVPVPKNRADLEYITQCFQNINATVEMYKAQGIRYTQLKQALFEFLTRGVV